MQLPKGTMRLLVMSDSHGDDLSMRQAIAMHPEAEVILHLGDGADALDRMRSQYPEKAILCVRGNCDWGSTLPVKGEITLNDRHIFYTHGHLYGVKDDLTRLSYAGKEAGAQLVLFGHTHTPFSLYEDGVTYFNPGSLHGYRATYGLIDLAPSGILTSFGRL